MPNTYAKDEEWSSISELCSRLKTLQADTADLSPEKRRDFLREEISRAVMRWDGPDLLVAVPGADPAVLADRFGKTLQNGLSGILAKPPPHLRFVAVGGEA